MQPASLLLLTAFTSLCQAASVLNCTNGEGAASDSDRVAIRLLTLLPYFNPIPSLNPSFDQGNDIQPAINLAVDQVNCNISLLTNYTLELVHGFDGCDVMTETSLGFLKHAFSTEGTAFVTGIIGPGCSSSVSFLSSVTKRLSLVMVHGGASHELSNRTQYPYLLGTLGSTENFVKSFNYLTIGAQWRRVALFYDDSRLYYLNTKRLFLEKLPENVSLEIFKPVSFTFLPLDIIREKLLRVIFVMCPLELTKRIICLAKKSDMVYSDYQFAIMSHTLEELAQPVEFTYDGVPYRCSKDEMGSALNRTVLLNFNLVQTEGVSIISNISHSEYLDYYAAYREMYNQQPGISKNSTYSIWATYFYDAVWAWALVLDNLTRSDMDFDLNDNYGNADRSQILVEQFYMTSFQGVSGEINFSRETGFASRKIDILQIISENETRYVTTVNSADEESVKHNKSFEYILDTFRNETIRESRGLAVFFNLVTTFLLVLVIVLQITTIIYRKKPSIKASTPILLHMSYLGVYLVLIGTYFWSFHVAALRVDSRHYFCGLLWIWCLPMGFTLAFCPVAVRTWRIYRIFKHYLNPGPLISTPILVGTVMVALAVDFIISLSWTIVDPFTIQETVYPGNTKDGRLSVTYGCHCDHIVFWLGFYFSYKIVILFVVAVFAILTRKITNRSFATASLRILVFLLAILLPLSFSILFIIIYFGLDDAMKFTTFTTLCVLLNLMAILCVLCIFIPPLVPLLRKYKHKMMTSVTSTTRMII